MGNDPRHSVLTVVLLPQSFLAMNHEERLKTKLSLGEADKKWRNLRERRYSHQKANGISNIRREWNNSRLKVEQSSTHPEGVQRFCSKTVHEKTVIPVMTGLS